MRLIEPNEGPKGWDAGRSQRDKSVSGLVHGPYVDNREQHVGIGATGEGSHCLQRGDDLRAVGRGCVQITRSEKSTSAVTAGLFT